MSREAIRLGTIDALTAAPLSTTVFCSGGSPYTENPAGRPSMPMTVRTPGNEPMALARSPTWASGSAAALVEGNATRPPTSSGSAAASRLTRGRWARTLTSGRSVAPRVSRASARRISSSADRITTSVSGA